MKKENRHLWLRQRQIDVNKSNSSSTDSFSSSSINSYGSGFNSQIASDAAVEDILEDEDDRHPKRRISSTATSTAGIPRHHPLYGQLQMTDAAAHTKKEGSSEKGKSQKRAKRKSITIWVPGEWSQVRLEFLVASMQLYKRVCPSIRRSVRP